MTPQSSPSLTLYPALDLKEGKCVRLRQGDMDKATIYADDPAEQARSFVAQGCEFLHVVDLDGATRGKTINEKAIASILSSTSLPVQLGGGIRDLDAIARWLDLGIKRVILGSAAVKNPQLVKDAAKKYPGRIVVGIDAREGRVATEGWVASSDMSAIDLARHLQDSGIAAIIFTEILRDGMLCGLDLEQTAALAQAVEIPIIASGGIGKIEHLNALVACTRHQKNIEGVIVGRALYDGTLTLAEAKRVLGGR